MRNLFFFVLLFSNNYSFTLYKNFTGWPSQHQSTAILKPPFQGKRYFCSEQNKQEYTVTIKNTSVTISYATVKIKGNFKNGLLFTNDLKEIEYRHYSGKHNYGKYYVLTAGYLSVLNAENSEYFYYPLCK